MQSAPLTERDSRRASKERSPSGLKSRRPVPMCTDAPRVSIMRRGGMPSPSPMDMDGVTIISAPLWFMRSMSSLSRYVPPVVLAAQVHIIGDHAVALVARPHLFQGAAGGHDEFAAAGQHVIHDRVRRRVAYEQRRKIYVALEVSGKAVGHDAEKFRAGDMRIRFAGIENAQVAARAFRRFDVERQCVEHIRVSVLL